MILERCSPTTEIGHILADQLQYLISTLLPNPDPAIISHRHLLISPCFLQSQDFVQLKGCRKKLGKILCQFWLRQNQFGDGLNNSSFPSLFLTFPIPIRPMDVEQWRGASRLLRKFLFSVDNQGLDELSIETNEEFSDCCNSCEAIFYLI